MPQPPQVGDHAEYERIVTADDIQKFAEVTGDTNPSASRRRLRCEDAVRRADRAWDAQRWLHLGGSRHQTRAGRVAVYLSQSLRFLRPVKIGDTIKAVAEVKGIDAEKGDVHAGDHLL